MEATTSWAAFATVWGLVFFESAKHADSCLAQLIRFWSVRSVWSAEKLKIPAKLFGSSQLDSFCAGTEDQLPTAVLAFCGAFELLSPCLFEP